MSTNKKPKISSNSQVLLNNSIDIFNMFNEVDSDSENEGGSTVIIINGTKHRNKITDVNKQRVNTVDLTLNVLGFKYLNWISKKIIDYDRAYDA